MSWNTICTLDDIIINSGVCALIDDEQVAVFRVKTAAGEQLFGISNYDPFSNANVISRGLVGSIDGKVVVASPIYKQHFELATGQCLEDDTVCLKTWKIQTSDNKVQVLEETPVAA